MDDIKKEEIKKQGRNYISQLYSLERRPETDYPNQLAKYLFDKYIFNKSTLLDVGCGRGDMLKSFEKIGMKVSGIDLSEESKELCKPIIVENINLEDKNFKYSGESPDFIFSKSLIEHLKNPLIFLESCRSILNENGKLILLTPSWVHHSWGPFYQDHTHVTPFTFHSLRDAAYLAGFKKVEVSYFYQLPFLWKYPYFKVLIQIIGKLPIPYRPMYEGITNIKLPEKMNTFIRFANETMLLAICQK